MIVEGTFFAGIDAVELLPASLTHRFHDVFQLTSDRQRIRRVIEPFQTQLGSLEARYLMELAPAVVILVETAEVEKESLSDWLDQRTRQHMKFIQSLLLRLWLVKDNACDMNTGWMAGQFGNQVMMHNNIWTASLSAADGRRESTKFGREELKRARELPLHAEGLVITDRTTLLRSDSLRYQRFLYLIQAARATFDVAVKVVQYCSALEALVSTASTELSHQVSERVAVLLDPPGEERISTYRSVKAAYTVRSKAVHGASFKAKDFDRLIETAVSIDNICRRLALLLFSAEGENFSSVSQYDDEKFTAYFLGKIFGAN